MKTHTTFEIEIQRTNVTPAQFLAYVRRRVDEKGGHWFRGDLDINYFKSGNDLNFFYSHGTPDERPAISEKSVSRPYEMQTFVHSFNGAMYNEICEFEFDNEKTGHGYYYLVNVEVNEEDEEANTKEYLESIGYTEKEKEMPKTKKYFEEINKAMTESEINAIIELAANDDEITHDEYCEVHSAGLRRWHELAGELEEEENEMTEEKTITREEAIQAVIDWFKDHEDEFNEAIEELDSWNGYLNDDRYYEMDMLDEFYSDMKPTDFLPRVFYGYDEETSTSDNHTEFNPNRDYFRYNGYGNLVSADYKDYSDRLDHWFIEAVAENRNHIDTVDNNTELSELFDALENAEVE